MLNPYYQISLSTHCEISGLFLLFAVMPFCTPPLSEPPSAPQNLKVTDTTQSSISTSWEPPADTGSVKLTGYMIEMCAQDETDFSLVGMVTGNQTSYEAIALKENEGYRFRIRARNVAGLSESAIETAEPIVAKLPYGTYNLLLLL